MNAHERALARTIEKLELDSYERHILLCVGGKCADSEAQGKAWAFLKQRLAELGLVDVPATIQAARYADLSPPDVSAIVHEWTAARPKWELGALYWRLTRGSWPAGRHDDPQPAAERTFWHAPDDWQRDNLGLPEWKR